VVNGRFVVSTSHPATFALFEFSGGGGVNSLLPASGIALSTAEGGTITQLRRSLIAAGPEAVFVTENRQFLGFLPEAPDFVNENFLELFGGSVPAGRAMTVSLGR
jgi:hypothetical protein